MASAATTSPVVRCRSAATSKLFAEARLVIASALCLVTCKAQESKHRTRSTGQAVTYDTTGTDNQQEQESARHSITPYLKDLLLIVVINGDHKVSHQSVCCCVCFFNPRLLGRPCLTFPELSKHCRSPVATLRPATSISKCPQWVLHTSPCRLTRGVREVCKRICNRLPFDLHPSIPCSERLKKCN